VSAADDSGSDKRASYNDSDDENRAVALRHSDPGTISFFGAFSAHQSTGVIMDINLAIAAFAATASFVFMVWGVGRNY
jgi:hypothetical protein